MRYALCLALFASLSISACDSKDQDKPNATNAEPAHPTPRQELDARRALSKANPPLGPIKVGDYFIEYQRNEVAADAKFLEKWVTITGHVQKVEKNITGSVLMQFGIGKYGQGTVQAELFDVQDCKTSEPCTAEQRAAKLVHRDPITLECQSHMMMLGIPQLSECLIVD